MNSFFRKVTWLRRRRQKESELHDELQFHLDEEAEAREAQGLPSDQAKRAARRDLGNVTLVRENTRDEWGWTAAEQLIRDIRFGIRMLLRNPGFTITAIATLAIGIGINAAVFTVTKAALFAGFPQVQRNDRLLYLSSGRGCCVSYPDFLDWRAQAKSFQGMAVVHGTGKSLADQAGFSQSYDVTEVSADTFRVVGATPLIGRDFTEEDEIPGAQPVAMLSYGFWERTYAKDPSVAGRNIRMNGIPTRIIGIMPQGFSFPQKQDLWVPLIPAPDVDKRAVRNKWFAFGRLSEGATVQSARAEMELIGRRLGADYPQTNGGRNLLPFVQTFNEFFVFENENVVYRTMWGAVGFVLLIACANLTNLLFVRAASRSREISVRIAMGAGRWRIVRQLLIESVMLSAVGGLLGWWIAKWSVRAYALADRGPGRSSWRIFDYTMDYHVLGYFAAISIGTAILFGLAPALRLAKLDVNSGLKEGGRGTAGTGQGRLSGILVATEMALALVLLAGAGVMVRSFLTIYRANLGVKAANVLTFSLELPRARYTGEEAWVSFYARLKSRLEAVPGVESVAMTDTLPTSRATLISYEFGGAPAGDAQSRPRLSALVVTPDYFSTVGSGLLSGRDFKDTDSVSGAPVALVNERFAEKFWRGENALGKRIHMFFGKGSDVWVSVAGVTRNIAQNGVARQEPEPLVYLPYRQRLRPNMAVLARTGVSPASLAVTFRREIQKLDADLPIVGPASLTERLEGNYWTNGLYGTLFTIFAGIALLLASVGLYAVMANSVSRRTQEIGVRMAIGATASDIRKLVLKQGMLPLFSGLAIGLTAALAVTPILRSALVQISPTDPVTFAVAPLVLIAAAMFGCLIPARRAVRVDPVVALRHE